MPPKKKKAKTTAASSSAASAPEDPTDTKVALMTYSELVGHKQEVEERLGVLNGTSDSAASPVAATNDDKTQIPYLPKTDTHWDFVMKGTLCL